MIPTSPFGNRFSVADNTGGVWAAANSGLLTYYSAYGVAKPYSLPNAFPLVGLCATGSVVISVDASGSVFTTTAASASGISLGVSFSAITSSTAVDSTYLYAVQPVAASIGLMNLSSRAFSSVTLPASISVPSLIATLSASATGQYAITGFTPTTVASGFVAFASNPVASKTSLAFASSTALYEYSGTDPAFYPLVSLTGLTGVNALEFSGTGTQVLASTSTGVGVYNATTLVQQQFLTETSPGSLSVSSDNVSALVCLTSSNLVLPLLNTAGTWSALTGVSVPSPTQVLITQSASGYVLSGSNVYTLIRGAGNTWSASGTVAALGYTGRALAYDPASNYLYALGGAGASGYVSVVASGGVVSTATYAGGYPISGVAQNGQVLALLNNGTGLATFAQSGTGVVFSSLSPYTAPTGSTGLGASYQSIWAFGGSTTAMYNWQRPYQIAPVQNGYVATRNGSTWSVANLGAGAQPSCLAYDASGNVWAGLTNNLLYSFSGSATGATLAPLTISSVPVPAGQLSGTTLGLSALQWSGGHLYGTTAFAGSLVRII